MKINIATNMYYKIVTDYAIVKLNKQTIESQGNIDPDIVIQKVLRVMPILYCVV